MRVKLFNRDGTSLGEAEIADTRAFPMAVAVEEPISLQDIPSQSLRRSFVTFIQREVKPTCSEYVRLHVHEPVLAKLV